MASSSNDNDGGMRYVTNLLSTLLAISQSQTTCPVHENCDGSCEGRQIVHRPVIEGNPELVAIRDLQPRLIDSGVACRDAAWLVLQNLDPFEYSPVNSARAMIRLLRIKTACFHKDVIECEMYDVCLDDRPCYAALSYYWGPPCFDHQIICNGKLISVTGTLHSALRRYRQDTGRQNQHVLWADALCINQADKVEVNAQLVLMHRIYSEASVVNIDLGHVDNSWYPGYDILHKLCFIAESEQQSAEEQQPRRTARQIHHDYGLPTSTDVSWKAYMHTFSSPWFSRTWTVQEVVLATKPVVRFGAFTFPWHSLHQSAMMFNRLEIPVSHRITGDGLLNLYNLDNVLRMHRRPRSYLALIYTMQLTRHLLVSDPRDKIIAVLGLVNEKPRNGIRPFCADYTIPVGILYHRFAVHLVDTDCAQPMLNVAGLHRRALNAIEIPSWVPDWTAQSRHTGPEHLAMHRPMGYCASLNTRPVSSLGCSGPDVDPDVLIMIGGYIDTVASVTHTFLPRSDVAMNSLDWYTAASSLMTPANDDKDPHCGPYNDPREAFVRSLLVDHMYTGGNALGDTTPITDPKSTYELFIDALSAISEGVENFFDAHRMNVHLDELTTFQMQALTVCRSRRFALTKKGYMGLVPDGTQVGDQIALILGAPVPFVLRNSGRFLNSGEIETMLLIGDAYIHGIMNGEGMEFNDFAPQQIWMS
ncbi:MAG: hypothetical protein Q9218_004017 [Villophora microphyllina]